MPLLRFIPEATDIDFVGFRYFAFAIDGILLLISIISIAVQGFNLGIDFKGGVLMEVKAAQVIDVGTLREDVISAGLWAIRWCRPSAAPATATSRPEAAP